MKAAVKKDGITYPVALDSDLKTWAAYHNQYWPAEYLIDCNGNVRREHFGEGEYDQTEKAIRGLLSEGNGDNGMMLPNTFVAKPNEPSPISDNQTPKHISANPAPKTTLAPQSWVMAERSNSLLPRLSRRINGVCPANGKCKMTKLPPKAIANCGCILRLKMSI